ncbi:hypothetical protein EYF80_042381 [Liparis tanakae]|uniref:Uncharacterized protein n=1 Tax=Liparis tanakae TaxID=230148 RepID=A0A4Z2G1L6_9TELE|nr:hypothetical protein EYF80_042381 [Liparis tanakae]
MAGARWLNTAASTAVHLLLRETPDPVSVHLPLDDPTGQVTQDPLEQVAQRPAHRQHLLGLLQVVYPLTKCSSTMVVMARDTAFSCGVRLSLRLAPSLSSRKSMMNSVPHTCSWLYSIHGIFPCGESFPSK